jgi:hypothetical protein
VKLRLLKIGTDAPAQVQSFSYIDNCPCFVLEEVNPGAVG